VEGIFAANFGERAQHPVFRIENGLARSMQRTCAATGGMVPPRRIKRTERAMNWDRIEGNWKQFKGKVKERWGKLTDDQLDMIAGKRDQLAGRIQELYGLSRDEADRQITDFEDRNADWNPDTATARNVDRSSTTRI
jgi:uncharacterized protein YjbJ (UPF0337 family)